MALLCVSPADSTPPIEVGSDQFKPSAEKLDFIPCEMDLYNLLGLLSSLSLNIPLPWTPLDNMLFAELFSYLTNPKFGLFQTIPSDEVA